LEQGNFKTLNFLIQRKYCGVIGIILKLIFKKLDGAWTGLNWLRIGTGGGLL
jgi:hypothetical protein